MTNTIVVLNTVTSEFSITNDEDIFDLPEDFEVIASVQDDFKIEDLHLYTRSMPEDSIRLLERLRPDVLL